MREQSSSVKNPTVKENQIVEEIAQSENAKYNGVKIHHEWYSNDSQVQQMVQYAYDVWWFDLVKLIECENWRRDPFAVWDNGNAHWLCQINVRYHKLPEWFFEDWKVQIDYCNEKMKNWTRFYWPTRVSKYTKWKKCSEFVIPRFTFIE